MSEAAAKLALLATVALLKDMPEVKLERGQVGVVVEILDDVTALVEFCDGQGRAYAISPCPWSALLPLKTSPPVA